MVNINLSAPEATDKQVLSGKSSLVLSVVIVGVTLFSYLLIQGMKMNYAGQEKSVDESIVAEKEKLKDSSLLEAIDFQERLDLLGKTIDDHSYWDNLLLDMGAYVLPEVRLTKLSGKADSTGGGQIEISGIAANLDVLSRELILLKSFPNLESLEFKQASANTQDAGVTFDASLKMKKAAFQK